AFGSNFVNRVPVARTGSRRKHDYPDGTPTHCLCAPVPATYPLLIGLAVTFPAGNAGLAIDVLAVGAEIILRLVTPALRSVGFFGKILRMADRVTEVHRLVAEVNARRRGDRLEGRIFFAEGHVNSCRVGPPREARTGPPGCVEIGGPAD